MNPFIWYFLTINIDPTNHRQGAGVCGVFHPVRTIMNAAQNPTTPAPCRWSVGSMFIMVWGPILHPTQLTFYTDACIVASLHPAQSWSPAAQATATGASSLAPEGACRQKAEECSVANDTCYFSDNMRHYNCATDHQIPGLNAVAGSAVGVAITFIWKIRWM